MNMLRQSLIVLASAAIFYWIFNQCLHFGVFRHVYNHAPGKCFQLSGIELGSEDIQVLPNGQAFISSGLKFLKHQTNPDDGRIYLFDFNHPQVSPVVLSIIGEAKYKTLNPHGISIWTDPKTGNVYLYVINHTPEGEAVDKFKFDSAKKTLEHMKRIENEPNFHSINDLILVAEDQFYYTNYLYSPASHHLEMFLNLHWGSIGFYNGVNATIVEKGLSLPNGIALSKDQKILYIALIGHEEVRSYHRNADNSLSFHQSVHLGTLPDNLDVDMKTGDVWVGAHPVGVKVFRHMENPKKHNSPSQVLRIKFSSASSSLPEVSEVYLNDGSQISASSVAVRFKNGMLVGSVFTRALYCQLDSFDIL